MLLCSICFNSCFCSACRVGGAGLCWCPVWTFLLSQFSPLWFKSERKYKFCVQEDAQPEAEPEARFSTSQICRSSLKISRQPWCGFQPRSEACPRQRQVPQSPALWCLRKMLRCKNHNFSNPIHKLWGWVKTYTTSVGWISISKVSVALRKPRGFSPVQRVALGQGPSLRPRSRHRSRPRSRGKCT